MDFLLYIVALLFTGAISWFYLRATRCGWRFHNGACSVLSTYMVGIDSTVLQSELLLELAWL